MSFPSFQSNSKKNSSLLFNVESNKFLLALSSWVPSIGVFVVGVGVVVAGGVIVVVVGVAVVAAEGSSCYYTLANQQN